jgi:hypothetical protein
MGAVPLSVLKDYDLYSSDAKLLRAVLRRFEPELMRFVSGETRTPVDSIDTDSAGTSATPGGNRSTTAERPL